MTKGTNSLGIINHASFQGKDAEGADTSLIFGDYNFLSALLKYKRMM
jgi:unsaturated chondroitin disaccharide hydrolase